MEPLTYATIEDNLRKSINRMEGLTEQFADAADAQARAEVAYKVGISQARLAVRHNTETKITDQTADDVATVETEQLRSDYLIANGKYEAAKQALYTCRERQEALRSLMTSHRQPIG